MAQNSINAINGIAINGITINAITINAINAINAIAINGINALTSGAAVIALLQVFCIMNSALQIMNSSFKNDELPEHGLEVERSQKREIVL